MTELDLTQSIATLKLNLTRNADWIRAIEAVTPGFLVGDRVEIRFDTGDIWAADVDAASSLATWDIDKIPVNTLIALAPKKARLYYISGDTDLLWAVGKVTIDG